MCGESRTELERRVVMRTVCWTKDEMQLDPCNERYACFSAGKEIKRASALRRIKHQTCCFQLPVDIGKGTIHNALHQALLAAAKLAQRTRSLPLHRRHRYAGNHEDHVLSASRRRPHQFVHPRLLPRIFPPSCSRKRLWCNACW